MENQYENYRGYNADDNALDKFKNEFSLSFTSSVLDHIPDENYKGNFKKTCFNL